MMGANREDFPAKEAILKLPRWARVVFAVRRGRRVQPLFKAWKGAAPVLVEAVDRALCASELSARKGQVLATVNHAVGAQAAADAAHQAGELAARAAADAAESTVRAVLACAGCVEGSSAAEHTLAGARVAATAEVASALHPAAMSAAAQAAFDSAWSDYDRLLALWWTDETPVAVERIGAIATVKA